jgi:hypothetical protein
LSALPSGGAAPTGSCQHCGRRTYGGAHSCKSRLCVHYGPIWAGDWRRSLFDNLAECGRLTPGELPGQAVMLAVTAPGARPIWDPATGEVICEALPWDGAHCAHLGPHTHSGPKGCRVDPWVAAKWNRTADERWSKLHRRAATETRRKYGNDGLVLLTRVKEIQKRGVVHWHPVLLATTPRQRAAVDLYRDRLAKLAPSYGFGFVSEKVRAQEAKGAAAYLSAYLVTGKKKKAQLQESVQHPALKKGRLIWLTPKLTQKTGITMRELRFRRFIWARYGTLLAMGGKWIDVARMLANLERDLGRPLTGDEVADILGVAEIRRLLHGEAAAGRMVTAPVEVADAA